MDESEQKLSMEEDIQEVTTATAAAEPCSNPEQAAPPSSAEGVTSSSSALTSSDQTSSDQTSDQTSSDQTSTVQASSSPSGTSIPSPATETSTLQSVQSDSKGEAQETDNSSKTLDNSSENVDSQGASASSKCSAENTQPGDISLAGASCGPSVTPQGGAEGPGGADMMSKDGSSSLPGASGKPTGAMPDMAKGGGMPDMMSKGGGMPDMMAMMAKGGGMPDMKAMMAKGGGMPDMMAMMAKGGGMPDMKAMMAKGGGMPDMMAMMAKGGGMPDMKAMMAKGGMPDMMAMMSGGGGMPDMASMMGKGMKPNPLEMAKMFECIIDVSLARPDSSSDDDDDDDSITIEIPCQYCSRFFPSQMNLKTHILVKHEKEDTSVLNLTDLNIDSRGKKGVRDPHGSRRKQSKDCAKSTAVEAAGTDGKLAEPSVQTKVISSQEDLSAAGLSRGVKRGRNSRKASETSETGSAGGVQKSGAHSDSGLLSSPRLRSGAVPRSCATVSPPDIHKHTLRLRSQRSSSGDAAYQVTSKKIKSGNVQHERDSSQKDDLATKASPRAADDKSVSSLSETTKHKKVRMGAKDRSPPAPQGGVTRGGKRTPTKDKDISSDAEASVESHPSELTRSRSGSLRSHVSSSHTTASSSSKGKESPSATRRSLRNRKTH